MNNNVILVVLAINTILVGIDIDAYAASFQALINPKINDAKFETIYQKSIFIDYPDGGTIHDELEDKEWRVQDVADLNNPGVQDLMQQLNTKIANDGSQARITDLDVSYNFQLKGRELGASIDYEISIEGTISNYIITTVESDEGPKTVIDLGWRGLTTSDPVTINDVEINIPINIIRIQEPVVYDIVMGTSAETDVLAVPIINTQEITKISLSNWHFLFDPTGINVDASRFGLSEEITRFVVSSWNMGKSPLRGTVNAEFLDTSIQADEKYTIRSARPYDDGTLRVIGFGAIDTLQGVESIGVTDTPPLPPEGPPAKVDHSNDIIIIALISIGVGLVYFFASRYLANNKKHRSQKTNSLHPNYQTNQEYQSDNISSNIQNIYAKDATCSCTVTVEMGSECDCEMQSSCLCDATCGCDSQICKEYSQSMR